ARFAASATALSHEIRARPSAVTAGAWALLVLAAILAAGDWAAVARGIERLEYVCKPGALAALIGVALTLHPAHGDVRAWFVVGPLVAYMAVISAMVTCAVASGNVVAAAGAALFMGSDALIAETRFVGTRKWAPVVIIVTYHLGQAGLTLSLVHG